MQVLDKAVFKQTLSLLALRIPCKKTGLFLTQLKPHLLNWPRLPNVVVDPRDKAHRLLLLNERIKEYLPSEAAKFIRDQNAEVVAHELTLNYDYFTAEQILRKVLPSEYEIPSAFETVGHIAHLNLKEYHLPYKHVIGQVILDKNRPKIKTVVNKVHNIISPFRVFDMEVLAGEPDFNVEVRESNCIFRFNYREVYWNSRLQSEHIRLVSRFKPHDVICDMFAGVGPFSIPAAKVCQRVYANDLNPQSVKYLKENAILNKKVADKIDVFNLDARHFVREILRSQPPFPLFSQVIMNLPASAIEFLDVFKGAFTKTNNLPTIHCYAFSKAANPQSDVVQQIECVLGTKLRNPEVHHVRTVAPQKSMFCVSFPLPPEVAVSAVVSSTNNSNDVDQEQNPKSSEVTLTESANDDSCDGPPPKKTKFELPPNNK
jgi:tRNA (guanine37-N1)-methyltransferase